MASTRYSARTWQEVSEFWLDLRAARSWIIKAWGTDRYEAAMTEQIRFGEGSPWTRSVSWAAKWLAGYPDYCLAVIEGYRGRVRQYYQRQAQTMPEFFPLAGPVHVIAVVSLARIWEFVRPADQDQIEIIEHWESPVLADRSIVESPYHEAAAREVAGIDPSFQLLYSRPTHEWNMGDLNTPFHPPSGRETLWGRELADAASHDMTIHEAVEELRGRSLDRSYVACTGCICCRVRGWGCRRASCVASKDT
jgi:hypothetical protein